MQQVRPNLQQAKYGELTQGTVFSCAQASRYTDCQVHGLTITARCDVAQQKYPVLNYLPLVKLKDWMLRDGLDILTEQERREQAGKLLNFLRQAEISEALTSVLPLEEIAIEYFPIDVGTKSQKKNSEKFHELVRANIDFEMVANEQKPASLFDWFVRNNKSKIDEIINRLSKHSVLGHYLIEKLSDDVGECVGYVCLLREVLTLPRSVAGKIGKGLDRPTYQELCGDEARDLGLKIEINDLAMPVVEIGSPTLEHIMQSFSQLFGRIGVADPADETIGQLIDSCIAENRSYQK